MAITAELHDGTRLEFPDGTDPAVIQRTVKSMLAKQPASVQAGSTLRDIPRQVGLFARYGVEGLGQIADVGTEPIRQLVVNPLARAAGLPTIDRSTSQALGDLATHAGLPSPETADERVIGDATRALVGTAGIAGAAGKASKIVQPGAARNVLSAMASNPVVQGVGAATGGASGGSVREAGGGDLAQLGGALVGGVVGGLTANALGGAAKSVWLAARNALTPQATQTQQVDNQINLVLQRAGMDWAGVSNAVKASVRKDVADALATGQPLNADALRRLVVMRKAGVTPTVGMLTQDPVQITREANLAKTGANSTSADLQRLPALQSSNTRALLTGLDQAGAADAPGAFKAGQAVIESLDARMAAAKAGIDEAYNAARATSGRSAMIDGNAFTSRANQLLDEAMVGGALPPGVAATMNKISLGEIPLTVDVAEQFKTQIGKLGRATNDGQARYALSLVRQAMDDAPIVGQRPANPGNLPALPGSIPSASPGDESLRAFQAARSENAAWMRRVENNPALKAVVDGVEPDQFIKRYIVGSGASAKDLRMLAEEVGPEAQQAIRKHLVLSLKQAATNNTDDINKFSNDAYRRALRNLGDEKLAAFFSADEIAQLKTIGEAGKYMQAQPAGTAVNNSNSGALLLGRGLDMLDTMADKIPLGGRDVIKGIVQGRQQSQALSPANALALPKRAQSDARPNLLMPALIATPAQGRQDERRNKRP